MAGLLYSAPRGRHGQAAPRSEFAMLDVVYVFAGCAFFAVAVLYAAICDKL